MNKPKNKNIKKNNISDLHKALGIPSYNRMEPDDGMEEVGETKKDKESGEKCAECGKSKKKCKC